MSTISRRRRVTTASGAYTAATSASLIAPPGARRISIRIRAEKPRSIRKYSMLDPMKRKVCTRRALTRSMSQPARGKEAGMIHRSAGVTTYAAASTPYMAR